ncbi:MAG: FecR family protein [Bryobacterales bacterium]|nr:FecR family protein [Bryobacterales bacterium]
MLVENRFPVSTHYSTRTLGARTNVLKPRHFAILALLLAFQGSDAQTVPPQVSGAQIVSLVGDLSVRRGRLPVRVLKLHEVVQTGDELITGQNSEALIRTSDGSTVRIFPDSRVIFSEHSQDIQEFLHLFLGSIKVHIERLSGRPNPQKMTTPTAVIAVRGTTFSVFVDETDATLVAVDEGTVAVANRRYPSQEVLLNRGERTWVRGDQPPVRAQAFRGRSERADLIPGPNAGREMRGEGMNRATMGAMAESMSAAGSSRSMGGMGAMSSRPGPPH